METYLLSALRAVKKIETSRHRIRAFERIKSGSLKIGFAYFVYNTLKKVHLSWMVSSLYCLHSFFSFKFPEKRKGDILTIWMFGNEKNKILAIKNILKDVSIEEISIGNKYLLSPKNLYLLTLCIKNINTVLHSIKFICFMDKSADFLDSLRMASAVGRYIRFYTEFETLDFKATLVASDYNPESVALTAAARKYNLKTIYTTHAHVTDSHASLVFDLSILDGDAAMKVYKSLGAISGKVIFTGVCGDSYPMRIERLDSRPMKVGIFPSGIVDWASLLSTVNDINKFLVPEKIYIRWHPNPLWPKDKLAISLLKNVKNVEVLSGKHPLFEDAKKCDLIMSGGGSVHLQLLKLGIPTLCLKGIDLLPEDYTGFVEGRIVPEYQSAEDISLEAVKLFYSDDWKRRFQRYDASYMESKDDLERVIRNQINLLVRNTE